MRNARIPADDSSCQQEPAVILTDHAIQRAQTRGVTQGAVYWASLVGQPIRVVGGAFRRTMTKKSVQRLLENGLTPAEASRFLGTVVITIDLSLEERLVITVKPTEKSGKWRGARY